MTSGPRHRYVGSTLTPAPATTAASTAEVDPEGYDVILFAGGHGTMWDFPHNEHLARLARTSYEKGGVVVAVCHGPAALVNLKLSDGSYLVAGKRVAGFTNDEEATVGLADSVPFLLADRLTAAGAEHVPGPNFASR
ncbi:type 1 glutamine amidotransferase domain-containing protein [Micromonospora sp. CPCC 206060]|uniref:type 1 glutamine amidotransferase domain-containing protein n=1 Tax=Micromonospora sp. CPCC 206060 TaxID=3122406 RepID=UPI002FF2016C